MPDVKLEFSSERIDAAKQAGTTYTSDLQSIRNNLDSDTQGSSLGNLVQGQLSMTEAETRYQFRSGMPNKIAKSVNEASKAVKGA